MLRLLSDSNYFIYLWHGFPVVVLKKVCMAILHPATGITYIITTFMVFLITVTTGVLLYFILESYCPYITSIILGKRIPRATSNS